VENNVANALSRRVHSSTEFNVISSVTPAWVQLVMDTYSNDAAAKELLAKLALSPSVVPNYTLKDGLIIWKT
jgi:iron only hydrogenase large subunit-like protein